MKIRKLEIEGFRGSPKPFTLPLKIDKSHLIFAENGRGKSTVPDAVEFLTTGGLAAFNREDCGLDAAISLNGSGTARVKAELRDPDVRLERSLTGSTPSALQVDGGTLEPPGPVPTLRQGTVQAFMQQTPGEKRQALLELLDLDSLNGFRATLRTGYGNSTARRKEAVVAEKEEVGTLERLLGGATLLEEADTQAKKAGLSKGIGSEEELESLKLTLPPGEPNRQQRVTALARSFETFPDQDPTKDWNEAVADTDARRAEALTALMERGIQVLEQHWPEESCPLCETELDREALSGRIDERAKQLAEANRRIKAARVGVEARMNGARRLAGVIADLLAVAPAGEWPQVEELKAAEAGLTEGAEDMKEALAQTRAIEKPTGFTLDPDELVPKLQEAAAPKESPELAALQRLYELQRSRREVTRRRKRLEQTKREEEALKRLLEICDEVIKESVEESLSGIEDLVARYFGILMQSPLYSNIKLVYAARRSGQVEFSIDFGEHTVNPPQRIMSESQLNALGLALLLARVKSSDTAWRTIILDDVVNSFDAPHRAGLVRLLRQEFSDWQVVILSHDAVFRDIARREAGDWEFHEIVAWTSTGGPVLGSGNPLNRLKEELDAGASASALGGHARRALESRLGKIAMELECRIPYDPASRYTAHDYLQALIRELKEKDSPLAGEDVLKRMDTASYMSTRVVHDRTDVPEATTDELRLIAADLEELETIFRCTGCGQSVWYAQSDDGHQCQCGTLSV